MKATYIIKNARVLTMDPENPRAQAVALSGDRILAVGEFEEVLALADPTTPILDAEGRSLLPGFIESHLHLVLGGLELKHLQLVKVTGFGTLKTRFEEYAARHPRLPLLMGYGATYDVIGHPMSRHDLDRMVEHRPMAIMAADHHTVWANTQALEKAGLLHGAPMPHGHEVVMGADGMATGELREFEAFSAILALGGEAHLQLGIATGGEPDPSPDAKTRAADKEKIVAGLAHCAAHGITTAINMDGNRYTLELLQDLHDEGRLTARLVVPFHFKPHMELSELDRASAMTRDFASPWVRSGFVKMFMDGVIDSRTAFMLQDYPGMTDYRAAPLFPLGRFTEICTEIDRRRLQIAVHAIGDGAVRAVIDAYAAVRLKNGPRDSRHRIEHIEVIDRADVPRLGALGITASLQPAHVPGAMDFPANGLEKLLERCRWKDAYLCRSLVETGAKLAFASDWPVADLNVMRGLGAHLTRVPFEGAGDERISLYEALYAYTAGGAYAAHLETLTGRLRPGLAADLVLIDGDIEALPPERLGQTRIALTIAGGAITHRGPTFR